MKKTTQYRNLSKISGEENCANKGCATDLNGGGSLRPDNSSFGAYIPTNAKKTDNELENTACRFSKRLHIQVKGEDSWRTRRKSPDQTNGLRGDACCESGPLSTLNMRRCLFHITR